MLVSKILAFDWGLLFYWMMATTVGWLLGAFLLQGIPLIAAGIGAAIFQWFVLQGRIKRAWRWVLASAVGWMIGYFAVLAGVPAGFEVLAGLALGFSVGAAQWLILRQEVHWSGWWIAFSIMGWTTGLALLPGTLLTGTMAGSLTGIVLEVLLRFPKPTTD